MSVATREITVAVATRGRPQRLRRLLDSLEAQTIGTDAFEVIVAVDGPDRETEALLEERLLSALNLQVVRRDRSGGPAAARNSAWRLGSAPMVAFTDDDCEAPPEWLEAVLEAARANPGAVIQGPTEPNPGDGAPDGAFVRTQRIEEANHWYQTCNIAYPRALLELLGGFDERFTEAAGEDVDLGWRATERGACVSFTPEARMLHAVDDLGPIGFLRLARRGADSARVYRLHPELRRRTVFAGIFWNRVHGFLALAVLGLLLARRHPLVGALLMLPYLKGLRGRSRLRGVTPLLYGPYLVVWDLVEMSTAMRGSIRHGVAMF
jgi:glycosyltransferase involved in cell wall biosynthesis